MDKQPANQVQLTIPSLDLPAAEPTSGRRWPQCLRTPAAGGDGGSGDLQALYLQWCCGSHVCNVQGANPAGAGPLGLGIRAVATA